MTTDPHSQHPGDEPAHHSGQDLWVAEDHEGWVARSRVMLIPMAAPSIMGLLGFMIATVTVGAYQAGWYGTVATPVIIGPLVLLAGVMQLVAAIASLRARDGVAVAFHTTWGIFWVSWGTLQLMVATTVIPAIPLGAAVPSFAIWFVALTLVTFWTAVAALAQNMLMSFTLMVLTAASAVTAAGVWDGSLDTVHAGGWLLVFAAIGAWLAAGALVLEHAFGRTIIPVGKWSMAENIPGAKATDPISYQAGMPGVKVGG